MRRTAFLKRVRSDRSRKFLNQFSRDHAGREVNIKIIDPKYRIGTLARGLPLIGLTAEPSRGRIRDVVIIAGDIDRGQVQHRIHHPRWIGVSAVAPRKRRTIWLTSTAGSAIGIHWDPSQTPGNWSEAQWE